MSNKRHPIVVNKFSWLIAAALAVCAHIPAHAQSGSSTVLDIDWTERHAPKAGLQAYDFSLLGDAIDLKSGRLSFEQVDVSIPGNFPLPVEIRRRLNPSQMQAGEFADWQLAIPTISTMILDDEWYAGNRWGKTRCNVANLASAIPNASWPTHIAGGGTLPPSKWSNGVILDVPGRTTGQILDKIALNNQTVPAAWHPNAKKVTVAGWYLECLSNIDGAGTEGFVAVAPNGDRYKFDVILDAGVKKSEFDVWQVGPSPQGGGPTPIYWQEIGVHYDTLAASEVRDVNGNTVTFTYSPAPSRKLTKITASDNRQIDIARTGAYISSVTVKDYDPVTQVVLSQRQWSYAYAGRSVTSYRPPVTVNGAPGTRSETWSTLNTVTLPNARQWLFNLANLQARPVPGTSYGSWQCKQLNKTVSVTHPDGVTGTFTLAEIPLYIGAGATFNGGSFCPNTNQGANGSSQRADVMAVTSKSLSGAGMPTSIWQYSYFSSGSDPIVTTVQQPDNSKRVSYFPTPFDFASARVHSRLTKEEVYATMTSPTPLETRAYSYTQEPDAGSNFLSIFSVQDTFRPVRLSDAVITRGSDIYNTHAVFNTVRNSATYSYGFPTSVQQWSNVVAGIRQSDIVYAHNTMLWILGLPSTITKNTKLFDSFNYDSFGRLLRHYRFGDLWRTYTYGMTTTALGAPYSMSDGLPTPRTTYFRNWKGGTPQEVERADGYKLNRTVNDYGWVTSITDWNGGQTSYTYDNAVGRLLKIAPPATWNSTEFSYSYPNGRLQEVQAQSAPYSALRITTTYDAMLRPTQVQNESLTGYGGNIFVNYTYDAMGRKTFASLPSDTAGSTTGIQTSYDALARVSQRLETAIGGGTTNFAYLAGNKTRITDPLNYQTTNTASGFGNPNDGNLIKTERPEGVTVDFGYNIYGKQTSVAQLKDDGSQHVSTFEYDYRLLLCRKKVAETGNTLFYFNSAYELTYFSEGQPSGSGCPSRPFPSEIGLSYDLAGRLLSTDYPVAPDIARTYDPNGNLLTLNRGGVNWTYTYNAMDFIESERLSVDGRTYLTDPEYNPNGYLKSKVFPSGRAYTYVNDGHGRPKDISYSGISYLGSVVYWPNNQISTLNRGIGGTYFRQLNPRQLVSTIGGNWGTSLSYDYDLMGRISLIDSPNNNYDRTNLTYDGVGRLKTASGPWGAGNYSYDRLGNIRTRAEGARTVTINYTSLNRVDQVQDTAQGSGWRTYSHDTRGNVTGDGIHGFTYDDANQPVTVTGSDIGSFVYDGNLKRVKQVIDGKTVYSIYDRSGSLLTRDDVTASQVTDHISLGGETFVRVTNGAPSYPLNDHLGSAYMVADQNGGISVANTFNFTPFGETVGNDPGNNNLQGFTGHIEDETGLTYMQARYYDPVMGRFLSADPIGYGDQLNLYAYVSNDPINRLDPFGMQEENICDTDLSRCLETPVVVIDTDLPTSIDPETGEMTWDALPPGVTEDQVSTTPEGKRDAPESVDTNATPTQSKIPETAKNTPAASGVGPIGLEATLKAWDTARAERDAAQRRGDLDAAKRWDAIATARMFDYNKLLPGNQALKPELYTKPTAYGK